MVERSATRYAHAEDFSQALTLLGYLLDLLCSMQYLVYYRFITEGQDDPLLNYDGVSLLCHKKDHVLSGISLPTRADTWTRASGNRKHPYFSFGIPLNRARAIL